ncbi:cysteine hydrolase family protein [Rhodococcus globerulus]|uniref:Cysteine hydrolase n=1 Tax=Rhodococcus globerulus TaxID=33008 RepID=A0ABU4C5E3_RHOGO|nr:cysteine hydrolase [Rhodococcus globerulus]MDV6271730.1 cysteine hydrolase [Rhodococcus globerulus]
MPLTSIDDNAALVVLDLQVGTAGLPSAPNAMSDIIERSVALAEAFREKGLPVIWVNVAGGSTARTQASNGGGSLPDNWTDLLPELKVQDSDQTFTKFAMGTFHDQRFADLLGELKVGQLVLTGVTTSFAVESTARGAYERNINAVVVSDAVGDLDGAVNDHSLEKVLPHVAEISTTAEVLEAIR